MKYVEIFYDYRHQTDEAVLVFDGDRDCWIPKSCIEDNDFMDYENDTVINVEEWFAKKEGLI